MNTEDILKVKEFLLDLQNTICSKLEQTDGSTTFQTDRWDREAGGTGITRVISGGQVLEKGGVNFSHVFGKSLPASASATRPELAGRAFQAMGVSPFALEHDACGVGYLRVLSCGLCTAEDADLLFSACLSFACSDEFPV